MENRVSGKWVLQAEITAPLLAWYDANRRVLPWREDPSPYHVWVSEIMLQQTRVEAVIPYYLRFLSELPDVASLAAADETRLLKLWEGLGYYSRVRNLQKGAVQVMEKYSGQLPADPDALQKIAGIGPYTAAAIASIAFGVCVPAIDGNLLRLFARLTGYPEDVRTPEAKRLAEAAFLAVFPAARPGDMNQALMDLGATVCLPNGQPYCERCPLQDFCEAKGTDRQLLLPKAKEKKERPVQQRTVFLVRMGKNVLIRRRPKKGLLAGLCEFPNAEGQFSEEEAIRYCKEQNWAVRQIHPLPAARHIFTHLVWEMTGYEVIVEAAKPEENEVGTCIAPVGTDTAGTCIAPAGKDTERTQSDSEGFFVPITKIADEIAIPSAFAAFTQKLFYESQGKNL